VPLNIAEKPVGVLSCYTEEVHDFSPDEIKALETLAQQAALAIENAKLQVRGTLMQEMHHRVKNNLQQVASLLRLQLRTASYKTLEQALNDVLTRILTISSVHDLLSREDLDHVGIKSIAEALVHHHQSSLLMPNKKIAFVVRGDDLKLNMNQATSVALLLNELISNAIEHGFEVSSEGEIHVTVEEKDGNVSLWVSNDGDKLPPGFKPKDSSSLGLQIVENLSRSMNGTFSLRDVLGWTVSEVSFPRHSGE
jgi:two-component sensor histidine kinase